MHFCIGCISLHVFVYLRIVKGSCKETSLGEKEQVRHDTSKSGWPFWPAWLLNDHPRHDIENVACVIKNGSLAQITSAGSPCRATTWIKLKCDEDNFGNGSTDGEDITSSMNAATAESIIEFVTPAASFLLCRWPKLAHSYLDRINKLGQRLIFCSSFILKWPIVLSSLLCHSNFEDWC